MQLATIIGPTTWPLSLSDAQGFVIVDADDDSQMRVLQLAIRAATEHAERYSGLTAQRKTYQLRLDCWPARCERGDVLWPGDIELPAAPVRDVLSVTYVDTDGVEQTVSDDDYTWERTTEGATVYFRSGFSLPVLRSNRKGVVRVTFDAGFDSPDESGSGDDPALQLPDVMVLAVAQMVAGFFEKREGDSGAIGAAEKLLDKIRVYR